MYDDKIIEQIKKLNIDDFICVIFIGLALLNIYGDSNDRNYLLTHDIHFKDTSNKIFTFTVFITLIVYIYYFNLNCKVYDSLPEEKKQLYLIKLFGSIFLLVGGICLLYFQLRQTSSLGAPEI